MLQKLELSTSLEGLSLELNSQGLSVADLEEDVQVVLAHILRVVQHAQVHLLPRCEAALLRLNRENLVLKNMLFKRLFL